MKKYYSLIQAGALIVYALPAIAVAPAYTFVSAEYSRYSSLMNGYSENIDGEALAIDLSLAIRPNIAITAGYSRANADLSHAGTTFSASPELLSFGIMAHLAINDHSDFLLGASFINGDVKVDGDYSKSEDINGGMSVIGIRSRISKYVEIDGFLRKQSIADNSSISVNLGAAYFTTRSVSIDLGYTVDSDGDAFTLGVSKYF
jgi:hypothetical protein